MAPDSYIYGLSVVAEELAKRFPEEKAGIIARKERRALQVKIKADILRKKIAQPGTLGKAVIGSSMQKETVEWMGFRLVGEYGRQEAEDRMEIFYFRSSD